MTHLIGNDKVHVSTDPEKSKPRFEIKSHSQFSVGKEQGIRVDLIDPHSKTINGRLELSYDSSCVEVRSQESRTGKYTIFITALNPGKHEIKLFLMEAEAKLEIEASYDGIEIPVGKTREIPLEHLFEEDVVKADLSDYRLRIDTLIDAFANEGSVQLGLSEDRKRLVISALKEGETNFQLALLDSDSKREFRSKRVELVVTK